VEAHRDESDWFDAAELLDLAPVPLFHTTLAGSITDANLAASELTGVERRFLMGKPLALFATDRRAVRALVAEATRLQPGGTVGRDATFEGRRGHRAVAILVRRSAESLVWAFHDVQGRSSIEAELRVLTEELEARVEERTLELESERARLDAVVAGMPAGVIVAEAPSGRIVLTNEQAELLVRRSPLEADRVTAYGLENALDEHGRRLEAQDWPLARALLAGEFVRNERIRVQRDDETWLSIEANAGPIRDQEGRIVAAIVVFWDVSERDRRERAEREFVTNAAHELQTPLAAIVSSIEVLITGAKDVPEDRDRFLVHIEREAARLVRVVRSLLLLARAQLAHESPATEPVRLRDLLDDVALGLRPRRGIEVVVRCPARLTLTTSRDLLERAVGNLAANSARHTEDGRITLSAARIPDGVRIEVSDTGTGIRHEDAERLFDRFARGPGPNPEGFGLGLAIVRESVGALGGSVEIAPRRGGGAVARIVLPESGSVRE
jgi:signal transduction histidine kinase